MKDITRVAHEEIYSLQFKGASFVFEDGVRILEGANFLFPSAPMLRIKTPEGGGRTTLLRLLAGLKSLTRGTYLVNDQPLDALSRLERARWQLSVGFGFEVGGLLSNYRLRDNLLLPLNYHQAVPQRERAGRVNAYLDHFGIGAAADLLPAFASSSVRKLCALARAFLLSPRLLILDAPTVGIHESGTEKLIQLIEFHQRELGLQQVIVATDDEKFLNAFEWETIQLSQKELRHGAK